MKQEPLSRDEEQTSRLDPPTGQDGRSRAEVLRKALDEYLARSDVSSGARVFGPAGDIPDEEWRARFEEALWQLRAGVDPDWSPEEIEADIAAAVEEVRKDRAARRRALGA